MIRALEHLWRARLVWGIVIALSAIQAWVESCGGFQNVAWLYESAGLSLAGWKSGHYASVLTYALLHGSWLHLACNALLLLLLGARVECWLGRTWLTLVLIGGTLLGALFHLLMSGNAASVLVGASGATIALLLVITTLSPQSRMFPVPLAAENIGLGVMISALLLMVFNPEAPIPLLAQWGKTLAGWWGDDLFRIGHACHFGGGLAGWLIGRWIMRRPVSLEELQAQRVRREKNSHEMTE